VVAEQHDLAGVAVHHARAQLVAGGVGDHPGVGLVPDPQTVVGEQARGIGVVGRDGGLEDVLTAGLVDAALLQDARVVERLPDPAAKLAGRLGGEGQAEHLLGPDLAGEDEVDHAGGHQRGLPRAGSGDDHGRREWCGDGRPLLLAGLPLRLHGGRELGRRLDGPGVTLTSGHH
jgi:hypothetical protein